MCDQAVSGCDFAQKQIQWLWWEAIWYNGVVCAGNGLWGGCAVGDVETVVAARGSFVTHIRRGGA